MIRKTLLATTAFLFAGCATLTSDPMTPVALSFSDGSNGNCELSNKRGSWSAPIPATTLVRRSDDPLMYQCRSEDGRQANGQLESTVGAKIVASAVFIDLGVTDAITDMHREYPASFVIPMRARNASSAPAPRPEPQPEPVIQVSTESATTEAMAEIAADTPTAEEPAEEINSGLLGGTQNNTGGGMLGGSVQETDEN